MFKYWYVEYDNIITYFSKIDYPDISDILKHLEGLGIEPEDIDDIGLVEEKTEILTTTFIDAPKDCIGFICPYCGYHHILTGEEDEYEINTINEQLEIMGQSAYVCQKSKCNQYFILKE